MELLTLVMYDIEDDRLRLRVAEDCKDAGLERVQYSVFRGTLNRTRRRELTAKLVERLGSSRGRILVVSLCERDVREMSEYSNEMLPGFPPGRRGMAA